VTGTAIARLYGELRICGANQGILWFTTLGAPGPNRQGVIGVCPPANAAVCQSATNPALTGWEIVTPPFRGGVTVMGSKSPTVLIVGPGEYTFDLVTHAWGRA
jgi:hypothetical protein